MEDHQLIVELKNQETDLALQNYFSTFETKIKLTEEARKTYGKELSPDFNLFDFWKINENKVSEIFTFFLDPAGKHEQGDVYLRHFLKKFDLDFFIFSDKDVIRVQCELSTDNGRRIDIAIIKNDFEQIIGIENKIYAWTADQKNQVSDYLNYLHQKAKREYCLLYLCPQSKMLSDSSLNPDDRIRYENDKKLKFITYEEHIIDCIAEFSLLSENTRVRSFLKDFERKLSRMYRGENNYSSKQVAVEHIGYSYKNLELTFLLANSLDEIKRQLKDKFEQQIAEIGQELGLEVDGRKLTPSNWKIHKIIFSYEMGGILYGLVRDKPNPEKPRLLEIESYLNEQLGISFNVSELWPMYQHFYSNIEKSQDFWLDIYNGEAKKKAKTFVQLISDNFNTDKY
jgi:hypothetical protein